MSHERSDVESMHAMPLADGRRVFYPRLETASTVGGDLKLSFTRGDTVDIEHELAGATFKYLIVLAPLRPGRSVVDRIRSFSGAAIKRSALLGEVLAWELVPLKGESPVVKLDCAVIVSGLH
jgi:hypothetical protein